MDHDGLFDFLFVLLLLAAGIARGIHWYAAHSIPERKTDQPEHGLAAFTAIVIFGQCAVLLTLASAFHPRWTAAFIIRLPEAARWFGVATGGVSIGLLLWLQATVSASASVANHTRAYASSICAALLMITMLLITANWILTALGIITIGAMLCSPSPLEHKQRRSIVKKIARLLLPWRQSSR